MAETAEGKWKSWTNVLAWQNEWRTAFFYWYYLLMSMRYDFSMGVDLGTLQLKTWVSTEKHTITMSYCKFTIALSAHGIDGKNMKHNHCKSYKTKTILAHVCILREYMLMCLPCLYIYILESRVRYKCTHIWFYSTSRCSRNESCLTLSCVMR